MAEASPQIGQDSEQQSHFVSESHRAVEPLPQAPRNAPNSPHPAPHEPDPHTGSSSRFSPQGADTPGKPPRPFSQEKEAHPPSDGGDSVSGDVPSRLRFDRQETAPAPPSQQLQHGYQYARKFTEKEEKQSGTQAPPNRDAPAPTAPDGSPAKQADSKLQFAADEKPPPPPGKKLTQAKRRAERTDGKLEKAQEKLPTRRRISAEKAVDPDTGKLKRRLHFEQETKTRRQHLKGPAPLRPVKAAARNTIRYGHKKMFEVESENVGTKAAHRTEMAAEGVTRSAYRLHKTRPYLRVSKLQQKSQKANIRLSYQQALHDDPKLKSNVLSRMAQKQRIKRQYAKAARESKRAAKKAGSTTAKMTRALAGFAKRHPAVTITVLLLLLLIVIIMSMFSSCSALAGGGFSAILASSYTAPDADIDSAEAAYRQWETDLQFQIDDTEADYPDFDEYRYELGEIGHNPYELLAYLTTKYHAFTFGDVEAELLEIFGEQYSLEFEPEVEIRYRTETHTDPDTGEEYEVEVPYEWHILNITLTVQSFSDIIAGRMDELEQEHFGQLMDSRGNRQYVFSPFSFDWTPYISCYYGWRVHPITGARDNHPAVDIAVGAGTEILAAHDGTVSIATWHDLYGNYIALSSGDGTVTKYAHCSQLLVSQGQEVKQGEVIAKVGSTGNSTGPHLHFEVIVDGVYLNPLFFAESMVSP